MMMWLHTLSALFWYDEYWWPPGYNWSSLESTPLVRYPQFDDMYLPIGYAFGFLLARFVFECFFARPLGKWMGIKDTRCGLAVSLRLTLARIAPTLFPYDTACLNGAPRRRKAFVVRKSTLDKFCESAWRFLYYISIWIFGVWALWDKPWLWETAHCWHGYPFQPIDDEIWWYYIVQSSFYWSLMISQFFDVQRKDFWMNLLHHVTTISLLWFSWADNFVRIGSLVLVTHDAADFWMELGKVFRYADYVHIPNISFGIFTVVWFITRVALYPYKILYSTAVEAPSMIVWFPAYYIFNGLLTTLYVLHLIWSVMIVKVIVAAYKTGVSDDVRSDSDEAEDDEQLNVDSAKEHKSR